MFNLFSFLPSYYQPRGIVGNVIKQQEDLLTQINARLADLEAQYTISTATWGLDFWEIEFNIPTDRTLSLEERREKLLAKRRGPGTLSYRKLLAFCESFTGGKVLITLPPNTFTIQLKYTSTVGVPKFQAAFEEALREIIPAHLAIVFQYNYWLVHQIHHKMTIATLEKTKLETFSPFTP